MYYSNERCLKVRFYTRQTITLLIFGVNTCISISYLEQQCCNYLFDRLNKISSQKEPITLLNVTIFALLNAQGANFIIQNSSQTTQ